MLRERKQKRVVLLWGTQNMKTQLHPNSRLNLSAKVLGIHSFVPKQGNKSKAISHEQNLG